MKLQIIVPQCEAVPTSYPPYGALSIGTYVKKYGYEVDIINLDLLRCSDQFVLEQVRKFNPDVIGFSAIVSTSYGHIKKLSRVIKINFPDTLIILGGQLSNAAKPLLQHTPIDIIVIGEGEHTIIRLLDRLKNGQDIYAVKGIASRNGEQVRYTPPRDQIKRLDTLPFPDFELIDMNSYILDPFERYGSFIKYIDKMDNRFREPHRRGQKTFTIMTGRGCHAKCTFCCRNMKGLRKHSAGYILDLMELLKDKYNIGYFTFGDESFVSSKKWTLDFLEKMQKRKLDVLFYVLGARVDTVDRELLAALKEAGCFMIEYGFETGSQRMLDMMEKKTTVAENYRVYWMTREIGLHTIPANVINMPGETPETIHKTIQFLKSLEMDPPQYIVKYAQAHPGTPLYEYALLTGLIENEDDYLSGFTDVHPQNYSEACRKGVFLNFSGQPLEEVLAWHRRIAAELEMDYVLLRDGSYAGNLIRIIIYPRILNMLRVMARQGIAKTVRYYLPMIKNVCKAYLGKMRPKQMGYSGSDSDETPYINQLVSTEDDLIEVIKKGKYDSRKILKTSIDNHIETYVDRIGDCFLIRYPSLRKVCQKIRESVIEGSDVANKDDPPLISTPKQ